MSAYCSKINDFDHMFRKGPFSNLFIKANVILHIKYIVVQVYALYYYYINLTCISCLLPLDGDFIHSLRQSACRTDYVNIKLCAANCLANLLLLVRVSLLYKDKINSSITSGLVSNVNSTAVLKRSGDIFE